MQLTPDESQINQGQQDKHIEGTNNYVPGRSILTDPDPQGLLNTFGGTGTAVNNVPRGQPGYKEGIDFGKIIGQYVDPSTSQAIPTTDGIINYGRREVHIISPRSN